MLERLHQQLDRLLLEKLARFAGNDRIQRAAALERDHRTACGLRLDRRDAEILQAGEDKRPAARQQIRAVPRPARSREIAPSARPSLPAAPGRALCRRSSAAGPAGCRPARPDRCACRGSGARRSGNSLRRVAGRRRSARRLDGRIDDGRVAVVSSAWMRAWISRADGDELVDALRGGVIPPAEQPRRSGAAQSARCGRSSRGPGRLPDSRRSGWAPGSSRCAACPARFRTP